MFAISSTVQTFVVSRRSHVAFVNLSRLMRVELMWSRIGLLSSGSVCNPAPKSACVHESFAVRKEKEEVETENLRLRATKTVLVFEDGEWESPAAPCLPVAKSKSKWKGKERTAAADSCCGRSMNTNPANAGQPSDQRWFRLMFLEIPVLVYVSGCAEGNAKNATSHAVLHPRIGWLAVEIDSWHVSVISSFVWSIEVAPRTRGSGASRGLLSTL